MLFVELKCCAHESRQALLDEFSGFITCSMEDASLHFFISCTKDMVHFQFDVDKEAFRGDNCLPLFRKF